MAQKEVVEITAELFDGLDEFLLNVGRLVEVELSNVLNVCGFIFRKIDVHRATLYAHNRLGVRF